MSEWPSKMDVMEELIDDTNVLSNRELSRKIKNQTIDACRAAHEAEVKDLREALEGVMKLIDDEILVRDISRDDYPDWAIKQLSILTTLQRARKALKRQEEK